MPNAIRNTNSIVEHCVHWQEAERIARCRTKEIETRRKTTVMSRESKLK